jgi:putative ABC transport system substrate-binding protein
VKRREFITLLGGAAAAWPLAARAQQPAMPVIGILSGFASAGASALLAAFRRGLSERGFIVGQNLAFEYRWADGRYDRLPGLAAELIDRRVAVIFAMGENAASAAKVAQAAAGSAIPIVFAVGDDPVELGLVASLNRPGGNMTGASSIGHTLGPKRVELLRELVPNATNLGLLTNPKHPRDFERRDVEATARAVGWQVHYLSASSVAEFDSVFSGLAGEHIGALIIANETFFFSEIRRLAALALRHGVPAIGPLRAFAEGGGLMSYGASIPENVRQAGVYTAMVLKGTKPADLPVMQPTQFELVINLKTAKTLGLTVPDKMIALADQVIE